MNVDAVVKQSKRILSRAFQTGAFLDVRSLIALANAETPGWSSSTNAARLNFRALRLLLAAGYLAYSDGGHGIQVTELGTNALSDPTGWLFEGTWFQDWIETEALMRQMEERASSEQVKVSQLVVEDWRQFSTVDIAFHPRLTVLTGANGAGKSTLLGILAPHFSWSTQLLSRGPESNVAEWKNVGHLTYSTGSFSALTHHAPFGITNSPIGITEMQNVPGIFISSHRRLSAYQPLSYLPPRFSQWDDMRQQFSAELQGQSGYSPLFRMKESLVSAAMYAYGSPAVKPVEAALELWEGYQDVLRHFLPESLQFKSLMVEDSDILIVTKTTEFPLEAVSGGISALLELSWHIYLAQKHFDAFTVCIDEPENHLHPELQRTVLPSLLSAFPSVTFVVATHSPLVVTSTQDCHVYALASDKSGKFASRRVENLNTTATPDETLLSVLGLDSTLPVWAEERLTEAIAHLSSSPSPKDLRRLRDDLRALGLDRQFPDAVRAVEARRD